MLADMNHNLWLVTFYKFYCSILQTVGAQPTFVEMFSKALKELNLEMGKELEVRYGYFGTT